MVKSVAIIELNSCKNSCIFCSPKGLKRKIDNNKLKKIEVHLLNQIKDLKKNGFNEVEISGCDPIEYSKIASFIRWLKEDMNFKFVQLSTHGRNLHNLKLVNELKDAGLDEVRIPLYGSNATIHDSITQEKGSFDETLKGMQNIKKHAPNIKIYFMSLIMKQNYDDIVKLFILASKYTSRIAFGIPCIIDYIDDTSFAVSFKKLKPYLNQTIDLAKKKNIEFQIHDIPYCVIGSYEENILNITGPPITSKKYSIPKPFKSNVKNLPSYRVKQRLDICDDCKFNHKCEGFYKKYIELFDLSYLKPL